MKKYIFLLIIVPFLMLSCQEQPIEKYSIEQFMNNVSVSGSSFSPDEGKIFYSSNESGIYNVYEIGWNY